MWPTLQWGWIGTLLMTAELHSQIHIKFQGSTSSIITGLLFKIQWGLRCHDRSLKPNLMNRTHRLLPTNTQKNACVHTLIYTHTHTGLFFLNTWISKSRYLAKSDVGRGCFSLTGGGGMGCLSALSAFPCCSLNDNEEVSLDDAVSSGLIVPFLSSYHAVSGARRLSHTSNQILTKGPSSHNHSGEIRQSCTGTLWSLPFKIW